MTDTSIQPFDFRGLTVRAFENEQGKPLFCAKDVAEALGYKNTNDAISAHCHGVANRYPIIDSLGRTQAAVFISEGDLYRLIASSKLPQAQEFESWVFDTVVPSIRKHGAFMSDRVIEQTLTDPDYLIRLATTLKEERQARALAESQVRELAPKARALDDFMDLRGSYSVSEAAKILANCGVKLGPRGLFELLCEMGWIYRKESHWMAKADRVLSGHLETKPYRSEGQRHDGSSIPFPPQVRVTRKGMGLLHRRLTEHQIDQQLDELGQVA